MNDSTLYLGKVIKIERYVAKEYTGSPIRVKVFVDNNQVYDVPEIAEIHLGIQLKNPYLLNATR